MWEGFISPRKVGPPRPRTPQETFMNLLPIREEYQPLSDYTYQARPFLAPRKSFSERFAEEHIFGEQAIYRRFRNQRYTFADLPPLTEDRETKNPPPTKPTTYDPHKDLFEEDTWGGTENTRIIPPFTYGSLAYASNLVFTPIPIDYATSEGGSGTVGGGAGAAVELGGLAAGNASGSDAFKIQVTLNNNTDPAASSFRTIWQPISQNQENLGAALPGLKKSAAQTANQGGSPTSSAAQSGAAAAAGGGGEGGSGGKQERGAGGESESGEQAARKPAEGEGKQGMTVWRKKIQSVGSYVEILEMGVHSKLTRGGRVRSLSVLILTGDEAGTAAIGYGKAETTGQALEKAQLDATHRPVFIRRQDERTIASVLHGRYLSSRIMIWPNIKFAGSRVGPEMALIVDAFGLTDISGRAIVRRGPKNVARAVFHALSKCRTIEQMAKSRGKKYVNHNTIHRLRYMTHTWGPTLNSDLVRKRYV
eukprot:TRINITY_DN1760_c0_g1_i1.p1 TRINITY_DN1760_c0_g1~~TRINITY_DN1760_c0_g1_i1.p1  ORF type:complete len:545 (-),score=125.51 TRINITY_DN1760_c0_g1_i1:50-1483(-)